MTWDPATQSDAPSNYVVHEEGNGEAVMFSFKSKAFFGKKKVTVKVEDSEFSEKFSLDVVGSSGSVSCKSPSRTYQVGIPFFIPVFMIFWMGIEVGWKRVIVWSAGSWYQGQILGQALIIWEKCVSLSTMGWLAWVKNIDHNEDFSSRVNVKTA